MLIDLFVSNAVDTRIFMAVSNFLNCLKNSQNRLDRFKNMACETTHVILKKLK